MLTNPRRLLDNRATISASYAARKDVFALGKMLGGRLLMGVLLSRLGFPQALRLADLEAGVSHLLGEQARAKAVVAPHPSIGTDIDNPEDVAFAREWFAQRASPGQMAGH